MVKSDSESGKVVSAATESCANERWGRFASAGLEFGNNGISDSLTGSSAPNIFMQNLRRAVSHANRNPEPLTIMTIKFCPANLTNPADPAKVLQGSRGKKISEADISRIRTTMERDLLVGSRAISISLRGEDFFSRVALAGFWIFLHSDLASAQKAANRFKSKIQAANPTQILNLDVQLYSRQESTTAGSWVATIDNGYFSQR